jgi:hypothetical protein
MKHLTEYNRFVRQEMPRAYRAAATRLGPGQHATAAAMKAVGRMWRGHSHGSAMVGGRRKKARRMKHKRGGTLQTRIADLRRRIGNVYSTARYRLGY